MNLVNQIQYTSIGRTFKLELMFIKICGGFMFDTGTYVKIIYRLAIIIVARFLNFRQYSKYPKEFESFSKAAWQNFRLFWFFYHHISHATVLVTLLTGIRYHNLVSIILKKRFDVRYLSPDEVAECWADAGVAGSDPERPAAAPAGEVDGRSGTDGTQKEANKAVQAISGGDTAPSGGVEANPTVSPMLANASGSIGNIAGLDYNNNNNNDDNDGPTTKRRSLRVKMVRNLLIANVLLTTLSSFLGDQNYARFQTDATQRNPNSTSPSQPEPEIPTFVYPLFVRTHRPPVRQNLSGSAGRPTMTSTRASRRHHRNHRHHPNESSSSINRLFRSFGFGGGGGGRWTDGAANWNFLSPMVWRNVLILGHVLFAFVQAALNINQTYGQLFVVLMVTATITDMLSYSCAHDGLISRKELDQINNNHDKYKQQQTDTPKRVRQQQQQQESWSCQRKPLLTTELLVQARDVLIVLRCTMGLDYLMLLIFELARLMSVFCMFNAAIITGRIDTILLICVDYISVAFSMSLTRLGYHWLHNQVRKLKRMVDETNLLLNNGEKTSDNNQTTVHDDLGKHPSIKTSAATTSLSQSEMITTYRLADYIEGLWPTDWFTPDLKNYLRHNIFVITFVATLQQLVEAGSRFDYQPNNELDETTVSLVS